jgi:photosystem II stability/assembly factor-like uncharacterized protein
VNPDRRGGREVGWLGIALLVVVFLTGSHDTRADEDDPQALQWRLYSQGLPTYAMVVTVAVQPSDAAVVYAGTYEPPGLWRSDDQGRSWIADDDGLQGSPVYALHWDAIRRRWWVSARNGLYTRSGTNAPWQPVTLESHPVYTVAEGGAGRLYAATEGGLYGSIDAEAWEPLPLTGLAANTAILTLALSPNGQPLLVGTAGQGLWVSREAGGIWSSAQVTPPALQSEGQSATGAREKLAQAYVSAVLLDPGANGDAYASTSERAYRSSDGGVTWEPMPGLEGRVHAFASGSDGKVYAALAESVARSTDGGRTWDLCAAGLCPDDKVLDLVVSPADPDLLYAAAWDGLYVSTDSGRRWERRSNNLGYADVNVLAWDGACNLLAGTRSGVYRRAGGQALWKPIPGSTGQPVLTFTDAGNGRDYYAGLSGGLTRSTDGGRTWSEVPSELSEQGFAGVVVDPVDADHLYAWVAFGRVHESTDGGRTWVARWEGLGTVRPVTSIHRSSAGLLFAGAEDGLFRWEPAQGAWHPLFLPLAAPTVFAIESDRRDPETLYAGATDGLWRSTDNGGNWSRWGEGLDGVTVTALDISPVDKRIAFAGTRHSGLYVTGDGGATWQPAWDGRLATASVRDILFSRDGRTVYVASDQGIWRGGVNGAR